MSLGGAWDNTTPASQSKKNLTSVISGTGATLAALDKTKFKILVCTSSGSGLTVDHVYLCNAAGDALIDLSQVLAHSHSGSSDGGNLVDMFRDNPTFADLMLTRTNDLQKAQWNQTLVTSGTITDDTDGTTGERSIKLLTGTTSGGASTIAYPHLQLDFSKPSLFQFKCRFSATTSLAYHGGVGADDVTAADSNIIKYNAEVCTSTNGNWFIRSANGTSNSTSDTGTAFTTNRVAIKIKHTPATPDLLMYIDAGSAFQKTTHIPTSGATADNNLIKHSLKNSTTADKNNFIYGSRLAFYISDNWV